MAEDEDGDEQREGWRKQLCALEVLDKKNGDK